MFNNQIRIICVAMVLKSSSCYAASFYHSYWAGQLNGVGRYTSFYLNGINVTYKNRVKVYSLSTDFGMRMSQIKIGLGLGVEKWDKGFLFPLTFNFHSTLIENKLSPTIGFSTGYSLGQRDSSIHDGIERGSFVIKASVGISYMFPKKKYVILNALYNGQNMRSVFQRNINSNAGNLTRYSIFYHFFGVEAGIIFD